MCRRPWVCARVFVRVCVCVWVWVWVGACRCMWACVGVCGRVWARVGVGGHVWACVGLCVAVWLWLAGWLAGWLGRWSRCFLLEHLGSRMSEPCRMLARMTVCYVRFCLSYFAQDLGGLSTYKEMRMRLRGTRGPISEAWSGH